MKMMIRHCEISDGWDKEDFFSRGEEIEREKFFLNR